MSLIDLWKSNPDQIEQYGIDQIVAIAGDGDIKDESPCSAELREYLSKMPASKLAEHVNKCIDDSFKNSGFVLQDIINELGRRLDYAVENGRYRGQQDLIGFDGIWKDDDGRALVVEVKTTDAYRINLDTIAGYRSRLIDQENVTSDSSILIVVGRQDTGDIEAQIRGSRHAWDIRLISADALLRLVNLKESAEEDETVDKIQGLLVPFEYTRLDNIIDVVFTAAKDVEAAVESEVEDATTTTEAGKTRRTQQFTPQSIVTAIRGRIVKSISKREEISLIAHKRTLFWSPDHTVRVIASVSKFYKEGKGYYWYGFQRKWREFLENADKGFCVLGCVGRDHAFALPKEYILDVLDQMNISTDENGDVYHWHLHLELDEHGDPQLIIHETRERVPVNPYKLDI